MNRGRANALVAAAQADIAVFAAIAEDDHRLALQGRFDGKLNAAQRGVIKRGFAAVGQIVYRGEKPFAVCRIIDNLPRLRTEGDNRDRVLRFQRFNIIARGRLRQVQRNARHTAAGINDQDSSEIQVIIGDVLDTTDFRQTAQVAADGKILHIQVGFEPLALIENAGVNGDLA